MDKPVNENMTIKLYISLKTLRKIIGELDAEELANLFIKNVKISSYSIFEENQKEREKMEKQYEKNKERILHKKETRDRHLAERKKKPPKRKTYREEQDNV